MKKNNIFFGKKFDISEGYFTLKYDANLVVYNIMNTILHIILQHSKQNNNLKGTMQVRNKLSSCLPQLIFIRLICCSIKTNFMAQSKVSEVTSPSVD